MRYVIRKQIGTCGQVVDKIMLLDIDCYGYPNFISSDSILEPMRFDSKEWENTILTYLMKYWTAASKEGPYFIYEVVSR